jgi:hypothetical protein
MSVSIYKMTPCIAELVTTDAHKPSNRIPLSQHHIANKVVALVHKDNRFAITSVARSFAPICNMTPNTAEAATKAVPKAQPVKMAYVPAPLALPSAMTNASTSNATASIAVLATADAMAIPNLAPSLASLV